MDDIVEALGLEDAADDDLAPKETKHNQWLHSRWHERRSERETSLTKSWKNVGPEILFDRVFNGPSQDEWWQRVAGMRTFRLPVILLQMYIRREIIRDWPERRHILDFLPKGQTRRQLIGILSHQGYTREDIAKLTWVLEGQNDEERCKRFLELDIPRPVFLLRYLLRSGSRIASPANLNGLIEYIHNTYDGRKDETTREGCSQQEANRAKRANRGMDAQLFASTMRLLSWKCQQVESRLCTKVADLAIQYIQNMDTWGKHPGQLYRDRCLVFNETVASFGRRKTKAPPRTFRSLTYIWHTLKSLLSASAALDKPLLLNRKSFLAVRETLMGMDKTQAEVHNSARHAETWPPYLEPGDGIDEMVVPDENWSRAVQAGVLQQEAGYARNGRDHVLDTLQGTAPDGTPTIQQRLARIPSSVGLWEASIRSTRNAEEAWGRFQNPPQPGMKPGLYEYAAMFKKLFQKQYWEGEDDAHIRPGDRDVSFPTKANVNLSDFGKAQLKPPTAGELYEQMLSDGVRPRSTCLEVLVANAASVGAANKFIHDSGENYFALTRYLRWDVPERQDILKPSMSLFAAYIRCLCAIKEPRRRNVLRAIRLSATRFEHDEKNANWAPLVWGYILQAMSRPHQRYGDTFDHRLRLYMEVLGQVTARTPISLPMLMQFCKSIRKAITGEMDNLVRDMEAGKQTPLTTLFLPGDWLPPANFQPEEHQERDELTGTLADKEPKEAALQMGSLRLAEYLEDIVSRERGTREILGIHAIDELDQMMARRDPVKSRDAYEVMISLAFLGEFEQMASLLTWLAGQWGQPRIQESLQSYSQVPHSADFTETLCAFRLFAEPMLDVEQVAELRDEVEQVGAGWRWPEDKAVYLLRDLQQSQTFQKLSHVLLWARYWKERAESEQLGHSVGVSAEPPDTWRFDAEGTEGNGAEPPPSRVRYDTLG